jgi:cytochrome c-type biogenesis protein CcmH/NrfF
MRRLLLPLAGVAAVAAALLIAVTQLSVPAPSTDAERVEALAAQLRCPDCQALSVAESRTRAADAIRADIAERVGAGQSDDEIRDAYVATYGTWILLAPPDPLAWLLPAAVVLAAIAAFGAWLLRGRSRSVPAAEPPPPGTATVGSDAQRIREELEALDG